MANKVDDLGITPVEDAAISALSAGVPKDVVDVASRGQASVTEIPVEEPDVEIASTSFSQSQFDDTKVYQKYNDDVSEFEGERFKPMEKSKSARTALYTSIATVTPESYQGMYDQLASTGNSSTLDILREEVKKKNREYLESKEKQYAVEGDVENLEKFYKQVPKLLENDSNPNILAIANTAEGVLKSSEGQDRLQKSTANWLDNLHEWAPNRDRIISDLMMPHIARNDTSLPSYVADVTDTVIAGEQTFALSKVGTDIFGKNYTILGGTMFKDLAQVIRNQPTPELQYKKAEQVIASIVKRSGTFRDNDFVKTYALDTLKIMLEAPGGDDKFQRYITDVFGVADLASFLPTLLIANTAKRTMGLLNLKRNKIASRSIDAVRSEMADINSELDAALTLDAIRNPETAAKMGTTSEDELLKVMPKSSFDNDFMLSGAPNSIIEMVNKTASKAHEARKISENTYQFADSEYIAKQVRIEEALNDAQVSAIARPSGTEIVSRDLNKNQIKIRATYGDETDTPLTLQKALDLRANLSKALVDESLQDSTEIFVKNKHTGLYEKYDEATHSVAVKKVPPMTVSDRRGNLFPAPFKKELEDTGRKTLTKDFSGAVVSVRANMPMSHMDTLPGQILGEGSTKGFGMLSRWYINPQGWMDRRIMGGFRVASDKKGLVKKELFDLIKPFTNLSYNNKKRVANILERGDQEGKVYPYHELKDTYGYSNKVIEAYYSTRILEDTMYRMKNSSVRKNLVDQGYRGVDVTLPDGKNFQNAIRVIDDFLDNPSSNVREVLDVETGRVISVNNTNMNKLKEGGYIVGRLLEGVDRGRYKNNFIAVKGDSVGNLPQQVFPYRPGHMFRINKDPYFIDEISYKRVDGVVKEVTRTIAVEADNLSARKTLNKLNEIAGTGEEYRIRVDRNITSEKSALELDTDALKGGGSGFWFSKRGERLTRFTDNSVSAVEDPLTSLDKATSSIANVVTHGNLLDTEVIRHRKTYGGLRGNNGRTLWSWDDQLKDYTFDKTAARGFNDPAVRAALHEYEYLEQMKYTPTGVDVTWKRLMAEFDGRLGSLAEATEEVLPGVVGKLAAKGISKASKKVILDGLASTTPGHVARGFAFSTTIPLRPFRHIVLQGTTWLHFNGIDPVSTAKSFRDSGLLMTSVATYDNPLLWKATKKSAKAFGYSEDEWEELFTAFRKSGKPFSVDSDVAVGEFNYSWSRSIPDTLAGEVGRNVMNVIKSPVTLGKGIGFDVGELVNQSVSWLFAKRRWEILNPGKKWADQKHLDEITNSARNFSVDMTKTDALRYQIGGFAAMTQFLAIHNKMLMKVLPKRFGGDHVFSGGTFKEAAWNKGKFMAGVFAMYGTAGLGLQSFYDNWKKENNIDIHPVVDNYLFGGLPELLLSSGLDLAFDEEWGTNKTTLSNSISPLGGIFTAPMDFAKNLFENNFMDALAGPSGSQFPNVGKAASFFKQAWGFEDQTNPQKLMVSMQVAAEEFGIFSDYFRLNMAMAFKDNLDKLYMVSKDGRPVAEANSMGEIWTKFLLATGNRDEFELYNKFFEASKEYNSFGSKNVGTKDKDAKALAKWLYREWAKSGGDWFKFSERSQAITHSLHRGNPIYGAEVHSLAKKYFVKNPQFAKFIESFAKDFMLINPNAQRQELINYIMSSDYVPEDQKEHITNSIEQWSIAQDSDKELFHRILDEK